jgi:excisionase family DNA binding protein
MTEETKKYLSTSDLAEYLNISLSKVNDMVRTGAIPKDMYWQHNRTYRFDCRRIEQHLLDSEFAQSDDEQLELPFDASIYRDFDEDPNH